MKVTYDRSAELVGLGTVAWTRLGLEKYFDAYKIIAALPWDLEKTYPGLALESLDVHLSSMQTQAMVRTEAFRAQVEKAASSAKFIPYKPVTAPDWLSAERLIQTDKKYTKTYENKRVFREYFAESIPFAPFSVKDKAELLADQDTYARLSRGLPMVLQDESLSGGRGTFVIKNFEQYKKGAMQLLSLAPEGKVVISAFVSDAAEWSVQCCVTKFGVFVGPPQRQLVREPALCEPADPRGDKFCGAQIAEESGLPDVVVQKMHEAAQIVGKRARADGYRGVFGMDFLVKNEEVYVLEMNARMTGVTPLLTMMGGEQDVPFFLLHVLELGDYEYSIEMAGEDDKLRFSRDGSMIILHAHTSEKKMLESSPASGVYAYNSERLDFIRPDYHLSEDDMANGHLLVQQWSPVSMPVEPGGRLLVVYKNGMLLGEEGTLNDEAKHIVKLLYEQVELR